MISLKVNGKQIQVNAAADTPLLWVLRDEIGLTGTKFGCGKGLCGACTVHLDGQSVRSCIVTVSSVGEREITTIEGLSRDGASHPVQQAWIKEEVPQCGYCQSGQIMAAVSFLRANPAPDDETIRANMNNLCRCGTYLRIHKAIKRAAREG